MDEKETGMRVAYATVSSVGKKLDVQLDRLSDCDRIFKEKVSARCNVRKAPDPEIEGFRIL